MSTTERIQKVLAEAGVASRRAIEQMMAEGRVKVNGEAATPGVKIGAGDRVTVDGRMVAHSKPAEATRVLLYKKRTGELVTRDDPEGRKTVFRKLPKLDSGRWIAVGRLDINTSGLLLMTNDGELARRLTHPSFELEREYAVRVLGDVTPDVLKRLRSGVKLEDGMAHFETIEAGENEDLRDPDEDAERPAGSANSWWRVTLKEGRNREVRRLMESQDLKVSRLIRVRYGPVVLGRGVKSGGWRDLDGDELNALRAAVQLEAPKKLKSRRPGLNREERVERDRAEGAPRRDAAVKVDRYAKPAGWTGYKPRKPT
ncbi:MAG: hypothetical protein NVS9B10_24790 [Nevskia sp.]